MEHNSEGTSTTTIQQQWNEISYFVYQIMFMMKSGSLK